MPRVVARKKIVLFIILGGLLIFPSRILALEVNWPTSPGGTQLRDATTLPEMVKYFYEWGIALGGFITFFALIMAGFQYLTSAGNERKMGDAKDRITSAVTGLILLLASFLVLNVINPELTTLKIPPLAPPTNTLSVVSLTPPDISKSCDKVYVYNDINYGGTYQEVTPTSGGAQLSITGCSDDNLCSIRFVQIINSTVTTSAGCTAKGGIWTGTVCIKEGGACSVDLYETSSCSGDPATPINLSIKNLSASIYSLEPIKCIKAKTF